MFNDTVWERKVEPFEATLAKYQVKKLIELCKGPRVLDVGCGDGTITRELCKHFTYVDGVDASKTQVDIAKKNVSCVTFYVSTIEDFEPKDKYDSIVMVDILEHIEDPVKALKKIKLWLKRDGYIVIQVPNALSLNRRIGKIMGLIKECYDLTPYDVKVGHKRLYDINLLRQHIKASGLKMESWGGIFLKPLSNPQMEWLCHFGLWGKRERGWGDETARWNERYCDALYEIGKLLPEYCTILYARCLL
ncbi:MAG: class I SAM-dependent methyltransferase [Candidatus Bathyarchaeia archaeon]